MTDENERDDETLDAFVDLLGSTTDQNIGNEEAEELKKSFEAFFDMVSDLLAEVGDEDSAGWVEEPPNETKFYLGENRIDDDNYQATARTVTRAVLNLHPRDVVAVDTLGLTDMLRNIDAAAIELLSNESELTVNEMEFYGRTEATPEIVDALLALYSDPLIELTFYDVDGNAIIARRDGKMLWCWLPESTYAKLERRLDDETLGALVES